MQKMMKTLNNKFKKLTCWHRSLLFLAVFLLISILFNKIHKTKEGFHQNEKFLEKNGDDIFDGFYVALYDSLYKSTAKDNFEIAVIENNTNMNSKSKILDIGSGTGNLVGYFSSVGKDIHGLEKSDAMIKKSKEKYPNALFKQGDALVTITYPNNTFTHITCMFFTIYYIENKLRFFSNCMEWLKPGGYLILHLVDRERFDPIVPAADPLIMVSAQKHAKERITKSYVKFHDCEYKSNFSLNKKDDLATFVEKIKNDSDGHIRQNNHKLYMMPQKEILKLAKDVGFIMQSKTEMKKCQYEHQFIYVLTKPN